MSDDPKDDLIGQTLAGRYRIISELGAGGMGVAYRAWDEWEGRPVVVKVPKRTYLEDATFAERFDREVRLMQGLIHPHIVPILDVGEHEGLPFAVMRFLPGGSLTNRRRRDRSGTPLPDSPSSLHLWLPAIASALDFIHGQGVVHRDVTPGNIFFDGFWGAYLGDFGIAKVVDESAVFDKEQTLTATHLGIGVPKYMAPERFTPKAAIDGRVDQYALAVIVYEIMAGAAPFTGESQNLIVEVMTQPAPLLSITRPDLPHSLVHAVHVGLSKPPGDRHASCRDFAGAVLWGVPLPEVDTEIARLLCPGCKKILRLPPTSAGRKGNCPTCQSRMQIAADLGALWLLDEQGEQPPETDQSIDLGDFKPITGNVAVRRYRPQKRGQRADFNLTVTLAAVVVFALALFALMLF